MLERLGVEIIIPGVRIVWLRLLEALGLMRGTPGGVAQGVCRRGLATSNCARDGRGIVQIVAGVYVAELIVVVVTLVAAEGGKRVRGVRAGTRASTVLLALTDGDAGAVALGLANAGAVARDLSPVGGGRPLILEAGVDGDVDQGRAGSRRGSRSRRRDRDLRVESRSLDGSRRVKGIGDVGRAGPRGSRREGDSLAGSRDGQEATTKALLELGSHGVLTKAHAQIKVVLSLLGHLEALGQNNRRWTAEPAQVEAGVVVDVQGDEPPTRLLLWGELSSVIPLPEMGVDLVRAVCAAAIFAVLQVAISIDVSGPAVDVLGEMVRVVDTAPRVLTVRWTRQIGVY